MNKFLKIAGIAALAATLGVVAVGAVAFAQGPFGGPGIGPFGGGHGRFPLLSPEQAEAHHEQMQQAMAEALGMTVEELDAAHVEGKTLREIAEEQGVDLADVRDTMRVPFEQMLDQAVAGGMLTQEQADIIRQRMENMPGGGLWGPADGFPGFPGEHGSRPFLDPEKAEAHHEKMQQAMAEALGMTVEELDAAHAEGKTLREIAEEQGVDLADVRDTMRVPFEQMLDQAVSGGMLTQGQADTIRQHMADGHGPWEGRGGFPRFPGKHGDHPFLDPEQAEAHHEQMQQAMAEALGMTVEELEAARAEGQALWEIAEGQGADLAEVRDALKIAGQELLDQAVADGTLTQEQADNIRQHMEDMPGRGPWGMRGRFPGFPRWHGDAK